MRIWTCSCKAHDVMKNLAVVEDEADLVTAARSGRDDAFSELVKLHEPHQVRLAMRLVSNREDAEEVVQQALLAAWWNMPKFRCEAGFRTWLSSITWNFGLVALRRRKRQRLASDGAKFLDGYPDRTTANPEQRAISLDLASRVRRQVLNLPSQGRDPLYMWTFEEMNLGEIARELNLTVPAVKTRLFRARQEVRRKLTAAGSGNALRQAQDGSPSHHSRRQNPS